MRRFIRFIKTTAIGGLLVIVPIAIILFVLAQLFYGLYSVTESVAETFNIGKGDALVVFSIAAAALVSLCFVTGLLVQTRLGLFLKSWFNRNIAQRIPMYKAISSLTHRFAGIQGHEFAPVEVDLYGTATRVVGFQIENLPNQRCAVFIPSAPLATAGSVFIVPRDNVTTLQASVADTLSAVTQWGVDAKNLYVKESDDEQQSS